MILQKEVEYFDVCFGIVVSGLRGNVFSDIVYMMTASVTSLNITDSLASTFSFYFSDTLNIEL